MAFLIGGANSAADTGYEVANSCRFNDGDSAYMLKEAGAGNRRTFTFNTWIKLGVLGTARYLFTSYNAGSDAGFTYLSLTDADKIKFAGYSTTYLETTQLLRDPTAWYMLTLAVDTTSGTANNRCRIYLNGTEITDFGTRNNPDQNDDLAFNQDGVDLVLASNDYEGSKGNYHDGYLAETVWIDGTQYAASNFGEFDEDTPTVFKPIDVSGLTFGTNGFYLDYEDSANLGNDANGGTDLTETNLAAADQATDTPTNSFCTINSTLKWYVAGTLSEGNCKFVGGSGWSGAKGTMAVSTGKWYWEIKLSAGTLANNFAGVQEINVEGASAIDPQELTGTTAFYNNDGGEIFKDGTGTTADYGLLDSGDILGVALDMDAGSYGQITFYDQNSAIVSDYDLSTSSDYVMPFFSHHSSTIEVNFGGCSAFAISSAANDGNGYGTFEFAPPSGYLALCTKNLATDG